MDQADIPALLKRMSSDEDAARKMAVFKLQTSINDPAFADVFISSGGLVVLRSLITGAGGNTLAYSLQSLTRLLEVDMGWEVFEGPSASAFVERIVELIVLNPLVNILRGAMSILVALVSHSQSGSQTATPAPGSFGFRALKPAVAVYPQFFELVVQQMQSADHALCANALMLVNALIRDALSISSTTSDGSSAISTGGEDWVKLVKRLQHLGLTKAVYQLMQSSSIQDLVHPALEFQSLTKVMLRRWREVKVDSEQQEHRRALKAIRQASALDTLLNGHSRDESPENGKKDDRKRSSEKWRRLGFETDHPAHEFSGTGYLGVMDLSEYARNNEDGLQKLLLEQAGKPLSERCPIARASLAVTRILYDHFEVDKVDLEDTNKGYQALEAKDHDSLFRPLLLQWSRLHAAGLLGFLRIWKSTGAEVDDFEKAAELVRILVEHVVGRASRTKDILEIEDEMQEFDITQLRDLQMELLDLSFDQTWGQHLYQVKETLKQEALQFVKEQRVRCLLQGSWFCKPATAHNGEQRQQQQQQNNNDDDYDDNDNKNDDDRKKTRLWRFAKLSHNRRYLHYADFEQQMAQDPDLDVLTKKIDLGTISSVGSNVSAAAADDNQSNASGSTVQNLASQPSRKTINTGATTITTTNITIYAATMSKGVETDEYPVLTLWPVTPSLASEWLDGLLMLLNQAPITAETNKLVDMASNYGLKIRLLNVRMDSAFEGPPPGAGVVPSRSGLDEDYFYEV